MSAEGIGPADYNGGIPPLYDRAGFRRARAAHAIPPRLGESGISQIDGVPIESAEAAPAPTPAAATPKPRPVLPWLVLGGAVSLALLWLAARGVDLGEVGAALQQTQPGLVVAGCALILLSYPVLALRWTVIARHTGPPPFRGALELVLIGAAVNNALPGRLGEVARALGLSRLVRRPFLQALGTVVVDRIADVVFFAVCFGATLPLVPGADWVRAIGVSGAIFAMVILAGLVAAVLVVRRRGPSSGSHGGLLRHLGVFARGLDCIRSASALVAVMACTAAAWSVWILGAWLVGRSLGLELSGAEIVFTTGALGLGSVIPSAPGYIGTYHWLAASALGLFGVARPDALAFAVLIHATWFVPTTIAGLALMARRGLDFAMVRRAPRPAH
jgi:uncharacterized protein (TIRG00374 family)